MRGSQQISLQQERRSPRRQYRRSIFINIARRISTSKGFLTLALHQRTSFTRLESIRCRCPLSQRTSQCSSSNMQTIRQHPFLRRGCIKISRLVHSTSLLLPLLLSLKGRRNPCHWILIGISLFQETYIIMTLSRKMALLRFQIYYPINIIIIIITTIIIRNRICNRRCTLRH